ncbi:MAG: hypothetical protein ABJA16_00920 [Nakamurella sp.]
MTAPDHEPTEVPTQAVSPGADAEEPRDDPRQNDAEMTDPAKAIAAEFPGQ